MPTEEQQRMDNAANEAEKALENIPNEVLLPTAQWFKQWYMTAGHTRLGRILVAVAKDLEKQSR
ncbi:MAG: hypothetical protein QGI51_03515 [Dehalococcoidales bacterium]|jgi:hypothetical protein|nr:hypothetical protein [Dehalococcoidales bacterium]